MQVANGLYRACHLRRFGVPDVMSMDHVTRTHIDDAPSWTCQEGQFYSDRITSRVDSLKSRSASGDFLQSVPLPDTNIVTDNITLLDCT